MINHPTSLPLLEELRGACVLVRPYRPEDAEALFEAIDESREHIGRWLSWPDTYVTVHDARLSIARWRMQYMLREKFTCCICAHDGSEGEERFVGSCALTPLDWDLSYYSLGYWVRASATGRGYVTEAARLLLAWAFTHYQAQRIEITCDERNNASAAVARRLGFVQEARLRNHRPTVTGQPRNTLVFSLLPHEYQAMYAAQ